MLAAAASSRSSASTTAASNRGPADPTGSQRLSLCPHPRLANCTSKVYMEAMTCMRCRPHNIRLDIDECYRILSAPAIRHHFFPCVYTHVLLNRCPIPHFLTPFLTFGTIRIDELLRKRALSTKKARHEGRKGKPASPGRQTSGRPLNCDSRAVITKREGDGPLRRHPTRGFLILASLGA